MWCLWKRTTIAPGAAMLRKLCYEAIEKRAVRSSLVDAEEQDICCQDLVSPIAVELSHVYGGRADGRPAGAPSADAQNAFGI
jgi:hypothetical protein